MSEQNPDEELRHQAFIRVMRLFFAGKGTCPGCQQQDIFARLSASPGAAKEHCLECWRTER